MERQSRRLWGREKVAAELKRKAQEAIDAEALDARPDLKSRVLSMSFAEAVARLGFVEYQGTARFELTRGERTLSVFEETKIEQGLHGTFRVLQKNEEDEVLRETVYNNGVLYVRNGPGKLRVQGIRQEQPWKVREEAWQPLRVYTSYYGPRLGLAKAREAVVAGRPAVKYELTLLDGSEYVEVPGMKGKKKPVSVDGALFVDRATSVPVKAEMTGTLEIPAKDTETTPPGTLELTLDYVLKPGEEKEVKPGEFVPTIKHRPEDLDPLAFLDGGTRTSTVIGGPTEDAGDEDEESE